MGPTNVALVKLFEADKKYREAQGRYDAASRDVRIQERKVNDLASKLEAAQVQLQQQQAKAGTADLDIRSRDSHIDKLREQQQLAKNNKEYQNFLVQINTEKVDKAKVEDEMLKIMEQVEKLQQEVTQVTSQLDAEKQKLEQVRTQITGRLEELKKDIDAAKPARDEAAAAVSARDLEAFDRLAERFDGEAMAPIEKPDPRVEEYNCGACNLNLTVDTYNRLHTRDEVLFCPSCRRILYIPADLTPETALNQKKKPATKKSKKGKDQEGAEEASADTVEASATQA